MNSFFSYLLGTVRRWPVFTVLLAVLLGGFAAITFQSFRLLGDDRELSGDQSAGPGRAGGHGTHSSGYTHRYYHK